MITETKDLNKCYGCFACANICPKKCISLNLNEEGFFMPQVDNEECIECGLCDKVCIIDRDLNDYLPEHLSPQCFYGHSNNDFERKRSASGGLAYVVSKQTILDGGVVFGVVGKWFEDVHHIKAETLAQLEAICGSKNIQSRVGDNYKLAKEELKKGKKVLFTGTPCQIAALYSYLDGDYKNLFTADLVCHGVPSQKVLKAYIAELEKKKGKKVIKFGRDETFQYRPVQYIVWFEDGSYDILMPENSYYRKGFLSNLFQRKSCAQCRFSKIPRIADISMGDVMFRVDTPIEKLDPNNLGVSLVAVNSKKGEIMLGCIKDEFIYYPLETEKAVISNRWLSHGINANKFRDQFFLTFAKEGLVRCKAIIEKSYDDMIKTYIREGRLYRLKLLFRPITLTQKLIKKIKKKV